MFDYQGVYHRKVTQPIQGIQEVLMVNHDKWGNGAQKRRLHNHQSSNLRNIPSGKHLHNHGKSRCSMRKLTISMAMFNSCVKLLEGSENGFQQEVGWCVQRYTS